MFAKRERYGVRCGAVTGTTNQVVREGKAPAALILVREVCWVFDWGERPSHILIVSRSFFVLNLNSYNSNLEKVDNLLKVSCMLSSISIKRLASKFISTDPQSPPRNPNTAIHHQGG